MEEEEKKNSLLRAFGWMEMARNFSVVRPRNKTKLTRNGNSGSTNNNNKH